MIKLDIDHVNANPSVIVTWSTQGVFTDPGETYDAGSGYFIDPEHVVTAGHVPRMTANTAEKYGVTFRKGVPQHFMEVHDPRYDLHWTVYSVAELASGDQASEFTILSVAPLLSIEGAVHRYSEWRDSFAPRPHRLALPELGDKVTMRGFTNIVGSLEQYGSQKYIRVDADACYCEGTIVELLPDGFLQVKTPCMLVEGGQMPGNTSGGPVVDAENNVIGVVSSSGSGPTETVISHWSSVLSPDIQPMMLGLQVGDIALRFPIAGPPA